MSIPLATIQSVRKIGGKHGSSESAYSIKFYCKDLRRLQFAFPKVKHTRRNFVKKLMSFLPDSHEQLFAYTFGPSFATKFDPNFNGWAIYDPVVDLLRMKLPNAQWRISGVNEEYQLSATYPQKVC